MSVTVRALTAPPSSVVTTMSNPQVAEFSCALGWHQLGTTSDGGNELEGQDELRIGTRVAVSDALQDLVARLAERLHGEAEAVITLAQEQLQGELHERNQTLE